MFRKSTSDVNSVALMPAPRQVWLPVYWDVLELTAAMVPQAIGCLACGSDRVHVSLDDARFVCVAPPRNKVFNDEHIIPRWVLRRFPSRARTRPCGDQSVINQ